MTSDTLLVPIDVQALCLGEKDAGVKVFGEIRHDFSLLPSLDADGNRVLDRSNLGAAIEPDLFQPPREPLGVGIHLHWALPDALAHGRTLEDGTVDFPEAPNRWLVARIATTSRREQVAPRDLQAWIVESDHLWPAQDGGRQGSRAVPIASSPMTLPNAAVMAMGRAFRQEEWHEPMGSLYAARHTALGYGITSYAAAYAHCPNVFGFHDRLDSFDLATFDPANSRLSYLVAGWYSDGRKDPLAALVGMMGTDAEKRAWMAETLKWTYEAAGDAPLPRRVVCHGLLADVEWNPKRRQYVQARQPQPATLALGNTTVEAASALLASQPSLADLEDAEPVLNALQLGLLPSLAEPGGLARVDDRLHEEGFTGSTGGTIWAVTPKPSDLRDAPRNQPELLPAHLATLVNVLNVRQDRRDRLAAAIDSQRSQLFADWHKYSVLRHDEEEDPDAGVELVEGITVEAAYGHLEAMVASLDARLRALDALDQDIVAAKRDVELAIRAPGAGKFELKAVPSPRFWQPREPVIMLAGEHLAASDRHGGDGDDRPDGLLQCRLGALIVSDIRTPGPRLKANDLPRLKGPSSGAPADTLNALVTEAFLLDSNRAELLALLLVLKGARVLTTEVAEAQRALWAGTPPPSSSKISFTGTPPAGRGLRRWSPPWIPMFLQWEVSFYPTLAAGGEGHARARYPADFLTSNFTLDGDDIDLVSRKPTPTRFTETEPYLGMTVLTPNTTVSLRAQMDAYLQHYADKDGELRRIADSLALTAMSQSLGGFNQALLMRRQTLQLEVSDPLARNDGYRRATFLNATLPASIGSRNDLAPVPFGGFNPWRAGFMKVHALRLIDAFGQAQDLSDIRIVRAGGLVPHDRPDDQVAALAPRLVPPARLLFRWRSASNDLVDMNSHPASSPVCGWVLFNALDRALMIYDADGNALGSLNTRGALWQGAPGDDRTFTHTVRDVLADANAHLAAFVLGIYERSDGAARFLEAMLSAIDGALATMHTTGHREDQGLSVLVGRPLALVRASLDLDLQGLPPVDQHWSAYARDVASGRTEARDDAGFGSVRVPVRLGDPGRIDDGLIGYFVESAPSKTYETFYVPSVESAHPGVVPPAEDRLTVTAEPGAPSILLTMLIDPTAGVQATTGVLPAKRIRVPPEMYAGAMRRMAVTFLTAPVLAGTETFSLPLPAEQDRDWAWVTRVPDDERSDPGKGWSVIERVPPATAVAPLGSGGQRIVEGWLRLSPAKGAGH